MRWQLSLAVIGVLLCGVSAGQETENSIPAALSPAEADHDFALQGEYEGPAKIGDTEIKFGTQVIALGDGKFELVAYPGGLPGTSPHSIKPIRTQGEAKNGVAEFENDRARAVANGDELILTRKDGTSIATLPRVERKSPTLGMAPPDGAIVLFDGTTADNFEGGRMTEDGLLMQGATSRAKFQDCTVHLEFMLSYMPEARGQRRSNSGCYLQGRYEVQILDSFGLNGENNECGGIYEIKAPAINMCYPPLAWQTYDIEFKAARFDAAGNKTTDALLTVKHNGVLIHENVPVPRKTRAAPLEEGPTPGPLYLQDHDNPVRFRNIWVKPHEDAEDSTANNS